MKQSEHDDLIRFHAAWKARCNYPAKSWYFIIYGILFLGMGILNYYVLHSTMTIIGLCLASGIFFFTLWMFYRSRTLRYDGFLMQYRYIIFAVQDDPSNKQYQEIFLNYEEFIGIKQTMHLNNIIKKLRRLPGSIHYDGENKTDFGLAYGLEDSLEDLAKRRQKTVELIKQNR